MAEEPGNLIGGTLGTGENQALAELVVHDLLEVLDEAVTLSKVSREKTVEKRRAQTLS